MEQFAVVDQMSAGQVFFGRKSRPHFFLKSWSKKGSTTFLSVYGFRGLAYKDFYQGYSTWGLYYKTFYGRNLWIFVMS
jgi:hypothetical protein